MRRSLDSLCSLGMTYGIDLRIIPMLKHRYIEGDRKGRPYNIYR